MAKISISGDFGVSPEASDVIFRSSARRCAKENVAKHGAKHSLLFSRVLGDPPGENPRDLKSLGLFPN